MEEEYSKKIIYNIKFELNLTDAGIEKVINVHESMEQFDERCESVFRDVLEGLGEIDPAHGNIDVSIEIVTA